MIYTKKNVFWQIWIPNLEAGDEFSPVSWLVSVANPASRLPTGEESSGVLLIGDWPEKSRDTIMNHLRLAL